MIIVYPQLGHSEQGLETGVEVRIVFYSITQSILYTTV